MKPVKFHPEAESEMIEAARFYGDKQQQLGKRYLQSIKQATDKISLNPQIYKVIETDIRLCRVNTFPFALVFREMPDWVEIIAVMHTRQKPGYWRKR